MNLDSFEAALSRTVNLISSLNTANLNSNLQQIVDITTHFGAASEQHIYHTYLHQFQWSLHSVESRASSSIAKEKESLSLISSESSPGLLTTFLAKLSKLLPPAKFVAGLSFAILASPLVNKAPAVRGRHLQPSALCSFVPFTCLLRSAIKLSPLLEACLLLRLLSDATNPDHRTELSSLVLARVPAVLSPYSGPQAGGEDDLSDVWIECLHSLFIGLLEGCSLPITKASLPSTLPACPSSSTPSSLSSQLSLSFGDQLSSGNSASPLSFLLPSSVQQLPEVGSGVTSIVVPSDTLKGLLRVVQAKYPPSEAPLVLTPLISSDISSFRGAVHQYPSAVLSKFVNTSSDGQLFTNMADLILSETLMEQGPSCNATIEDCRKNLAALSRPAFTASSIARFLVTATRAHYNAHVRHDQVGLHLPSNPASLWSDKDKLGPNSNNPASRSENSSGNNSSNQTTTWNMDVVMQVIMELAPAPISAKEVIMKLDVKNFHVIDRTSLGMFVTATRRLSGAYARADQYPVDCLYRKWQNADEQLSLINAMLYCPDLFCFSDYPCTPVVVEMLKTVPELENKEVATWRSLNLIELLLSLENTQYSAVKALFSLARQNCPDVLLLGLVQSNTLMGGIKREMIAQLMPVFLEPHPNTAAVLQTAWFTPNNKNAVRQVMLQALSDWYMVQESDQTRLSRILDVAQDLKALSMLLNATAFPFVIDLACLAFRREFLKLDKWLNDKVQEHGEAFLSALVKFVQQRCPQLTCAPGTADDAPSPLPKASQLPHETLVTITQCLASFVRVVMNPELSESILTISQNSSRLAASRQRTNIPGLDPLSALSPGLKALSLAGGGAGAAGTTAGAPATSMFPGALGSTSLNSAANLTGSAGLGSGGVGLAGAPPPGSPSRGPLGVGAAVAAGGPSLVNNSHSSAVGSQLMPQHGPMDVSQIFELPAMVSKDVEDEANSFFQRIYNSPPNSTLSIKEVLELLKKFHESSVKKEREVYACMLRNLFEEYKFFPTYPHRELFTTAKLFGGIIDQGLVEFMALGVALRFVMEALQKPLNSKMYFFGILALDRFRSRLKEYPRYCSHIMAIDHFNSFPPHLAEWVRYGTQVSEPPTRSSGPVLPPEFEALDSGGGVSGTMFHQANSAVLPNNLLPPVAPSHPSMSSQHRLLTATGSGATPVKLNPPVVGNVGVPLTRPQSVVAVGNKPSIATTNIETLLVASEEKTIPLRQPTEQQNDKIAFIFNNLSQMNLAQKSEELLDVVSDDCWPWIAQYLVMKRASIEANFHNLYSNFLDALKLTSFTKLVIDETLRNIKVLFKLEKNSANFSDKSLLKNLGHWLGLLTLAKNKPILHIDINFKSLLIEAYLKGTQEMQYVVPFVTKVLESCGKSKVFKPPNPWTMSLMNILAEIHALQDMKLHLKFEIEVLCNKLEITVDSLKPKTVLQEATSLSIREYQLGPQNPPNFGGHMSVTTPGAVDAMSEVAAVLARGKRAESTPLLPTMPTFPNQSFLTGTISVSEGVGIPSGQGSSSAGATPTPQTVLSQVGMTCTQATPVPYHLHAAGQLGSGSATPAPIVALMPASDKTFAYADINVTTLRGLEQHISLNNIPLLVELGNPAQLKTLVREAIEIAVQELLSVVMERNIKIAMSTAETLVKKDFALDPDETHLRAAAHMMVRYLTASMVMITSKDYLASTVSKSIRQKLTPTFTRGNTVAQAAQIEQLANAITVENMAITCAFIQKTSAEKAVMEMEKRLNQEYEVRKLARAENRHYCDTAALTYQAERMPEQMRLKVGRVTHQQMSVYEDFGRHIPGFSPTSDQEVSTTLLPKALTVPYVLEESQAFLLLTERFGVDIEQTIQAFNTVTPDSPVAVMLHNILTMLGHIRTNREFNSIPILLKKCMEHLLEGTRELPTDPELNPLVVKFRDIHLLLLKTIADPRVYGVQWTTKTITKVWNEMRDDVKLNVDVVDWLLRSSLFHVPTFDELLARSIEEQRNLLPLFFAMQIVQVYLVEDSQGVLSESDLQQTLDLMIRLCQTRHAPDSLVALLEALRMKHDLASSAGDRNSAAVVVANQQNPVAVPLAAPTAVSAAMPTAAALAAVVAANQQPNTSVTNFTSSMHFQSGVNQARDFNDPAGLQDKTEVLLREWINLYHAPTAGPGSATAFTHFVKQMNLHGFLKTDELITRFFRNCVSFCRDVCIRSLSEQQQAQQSANGSQIPSTTIAAVNISQYRNKCFQHVDPFVRLVALLIKHSGEANNPSTKINLLNKVLGLVCGIIFHDIESSNTEFYQLPYHRILIMLFLELNAPEPVLETINVSVLMAFTQTLHLLRPSKCAGFAYAWLEIVSHRVFIGRMLAITPQPKGWAMYSMLLNDLFKFLAPYLRNAQLAKPLTKLYKGTLRVLLVLLHDFPEFLCEYHYDFCDAIPPNCIQMRNLILSAFPRNMRLPDPFTPNLKVDMLPEIAVSPKMHCDVFSYITPVELRSNLDSYLKNRTPVTFLTELRGYLQASPNSSLGTNQPGDDGMRYNIQSLNALVVYVGMQAITQIQSKGQTPSMSTIAHSAHMDIFQNLAVDMDTEGRYLFLNAIANQLRFPNSHTHYFSCTLLYLFAEANTEAIQEQITRVLLERLIVNRPHPWGLLITFIELIKNSTYKFWSHEFVKCAPEIEKLFESVARSCMVNKLGSSTVAGGQSVDA
ncbi:CCR4-NOT transcription complex subunit 1 isoform X2 [Hyalella azteca]|uniref:CCR4-NOT transcription complex subunit 1 isoform X2 n=1 Tax=Hyalella azteca TaxID=294128 RepID=A0A8B7PDF8_HYAAZ|nr:CCR4-NOT transcription complex subunit 1 isoform X2 [Hyalella azteca]